MDRTRYWLLTVMLLSLVVPLAAADEPRVPTLRLRNGGFVAGQLLASEDGTEIAWQGSGFARPLRFPLAAVHSVQYPQPVERPPSMEPYCFELSSGDSLKGQLVSLDDREAVLDIPAVGKVRVDRAALLQFYRVGAADLIYSGPTGLEGWKVVGLAGAWRNDGGDLTSDVVGAAIERQDRPPAAVRYEIELAWGEGADFELVAGLSQAVAGRTAFRLETWGDQLVVVRESDTQADLAVLHKLVPGAGTLALSVLFDEAQGRLLVYSAAGAQLADFTVPLDKNPPKPPIQRNVVQRGAVIRRMQPGVNVTPFTGLLLTNRHGSITLRQLSIRRWSGHAPPTTTATQAAIYLNKGESQSAEVRRFDAETRQLVIVKDGKEQRIDEAQLQDVLLSQRTGKPDKAAVCILLTNGSRLSGELKQIAPDAVILQSPVISSPLTLPMKELQAIELDGSIMAEDAAAMPARLELAGVSLRGLLKEATQGEDSCLVFQPAGSTTASPLVANVSGKVNFRDIPPPKPVRNPVPTVVAPRGEIPVIEGYNTVLGRRAAVSLNPQPPGLCRLHLRSGDTLACRVESIDERGVTIKSEMTETTFVPHDQIKALELRPDAPPVSIEKVRFERLLTLPRMQRDNPPLHLIRSLQGDYLRGRLISLNEKDVEVEMRLETRKVARDQVTRILWLHPDEQAKAAVAKPDETSKEKLPAGIRVQAVPSNGNRLTFFAQGVSGKQLSGQSQVLGACHVEIDQIDQLLIGETIEEAAATLAFHQWKLRPAAEPLPDPDPNADPGSENGMESVLVGKPAPAIELDLLAGGKFRLEDFKDKVVVLDFWASWCGPCLQAMPQVDKVATEFSEQGVKLVAINLEETPEKIKTALSRLGLETAVALDKDGRIAERYGASDIPQTVIIGRDGKVARLFVGAGARFDERLRQALKAVLEK